MARVLLLLIIGFAIYLLFRGFMRSQVKPPETGSAAMTPAGEDMVTCTRCGVNVPRSETREVDGHIVCAANPACK